LILECAFVLVTSVLIQRNIQTDYTKQIYVLRLLELQVQGPL